MTPEVGGLIQTLGFPIFCVLAFVYLVITNKIVSGKTLDQAMASKDAQIKDITAQRDLVMQINLKNASTADALATRALP